MEDVYVPLKLESYISRLEVYTNYSSESLVHNIFLSVGFLSR